MKKTILVVEDEPGILETIQIYLIQKGFNVLAANNGVQGMVYIENNAIDLVCLDIMMPQMDGLTMLKRVREVHDIPVIIISAKTQESDKVMGLDLGADDYISKPFDLSELVARINANLRRYSQISNLKKSVEVSDDVYRVGDIELDDSLKQVLVRGEEVRLTPKEYQILLMLIKKPGRIFSAEMIYESVWEEQAINTETIMVHIRNLREKIEINPKKPEYLKVVWGLGYKLEGDKNHEKQK